MYRHYTAIHCQYLTTWQTHTHIQTPTQTQFHRWQPFERKSDSLWFSLFLISAFYRHSPKCSYVFQSIQSLKRFLKVDTDVIMSILQMEKVSHSQTNCSHIAHPASGRAGSQVKGICVHNYSTSLLSAKGGITTHRASGHRIFQSTKKWRSTKQCSHDKCPIWLGSLSIVTPISAS